jgi:hypothetical protein
VTEHKHRTANIDQSTDYGTTGTADHGPPAFAPGYGAAGSDYGATDRRQQRATRRLYVTHV